MLWHDMLRRDSAVARLCCGVRVETPRVADNFLDG